MILEGLVIRPSAFANESRLLGGETDRGGHGVIEREVECPGEQGFGIKIRGIRKHGIEKLCAFDSIDGEDADAIVLWDTDKEIQATTVLKKL